MTLLSTRLVLLLPSSPSRNFDRQSWVQDICFLQGLTTVRKEEHDFLIMLITFPLNYSTDYDALKLLQISIEPSPNLRRDKWAMKMNFIVVVRWASSIYSIDEFHASLGGRNWMFNGKLQLNWRIVSKQNTLIEAAAAECSELNKTRC